MWNELGLLCIELPFRKIYSDFDYKELEWALVNNITKNKYFISIGLPLNFIWNIYLINKFYCGFKSKIYVIFHTEFVFYKYINRVAIYFNFKYFYRRINFIAHSKVRFGPLFLPKNKKYTHNNIQWVAT